MPKQSLNDVKCMVVNYTKAKFSDDSSLSSILMF